MKSPSGRFVELDALRGIAVFFVLCYHYTVCYVSDYRPAELPLFRLDIGCYGVHLFFIISGFVIYMTLERTKKSMDFIVSRFSRLFPCYWFAVVFSFVIMHTFLLIGGREVPFDAALVNFSMLQSWFKVKNVDGVFWTLAVELTFYLLIYIVYVLRLMKYIEWIAFGWLGLMALHRVFLPTLGIVQLLSFIFDQMLEWGHLFFAGIFFYHLKSKGHAWQRYLGLATCLVFQYVIEPGSIKTIAAWFLLFYLFVLNRLSWVTWIKPLVYLGTISYSFYLIHSNMGSIIIQWLYAAGANAWLRFFVPLACSVVLASLMTYLIEKPAMAYIRRIYKGKVNVSLGDGIVQTAK